MQPDQLIGDDDGVAVDDTKRPASMSGYPHTAVIGGRSLVRQLLGYTRPSQPVTVHVRYRVDSGRQGVDVRSPAA